MKQGLPPENVIFELETTSAKIRALAEAGYCRTDIKKLLGISYQHVRNVLIDAGTTGGLRPQSDAEQAVQITPTPRQVIAWDVLLRGGFQLLGEWTLDPAGRLTLNIYAPRLPGVYAFVVDDNVVYVGLTNNGLRARFDQYRLGHEGQRTNSRVNKLIGSSLCAGKQVKILIATEMPPGSGPRGMRVF